MAKILIVDDDPDILLAMRLILKDAGHDIVEASSGAQALDSVKAAAPDLIILDVMMETYTEGLKLAMMLRSPDPTAEFSGFRHIPILMVTAINSMSSLHFNPDVDYIPVDDFVEKPIDPDDIVKKVEALLHPQIT